MSNIPSDLKYTKSHEWVRVSGGTAVVGITDHAQHALGDVVYVQLPDVGSEVTAGDSFGEVESTKSVSEIYAPVAGVVVAVNDEAASTPDALNSDPYGSGWLCEIEISDPAALEALLDAAAYKDLTDH